MEFFRDWPSLAGKRLLPTLFLATALMLGCSSSDDKAFTGNGGSDTGGSPADTTAPLVTADPELSMAPKTDVPLAGILTITTDEATRVSLDINDGTTTRSHTFTGYDTSHQLTVLGFTPGSAHALTVTVTDEAGNETTALSPADVTTDPLPSDFPIIDVTILDGAQMEPGVTLFTMANRRTPPMNVPRVPQLYIMDREGNIVWYMFFTEYPMDARRLSNGNLLIFTFTGRIIEIDMTGDLIRSWHDPGARNVSLDSIEITGLTKAVDFMPSEVFPLPNGNFLVSSRDVRQGMDFPLDYTDPATLTAGQKVMGHIVMEFNPDGTVVREWPLLDLFDPARLVYGAIKSSGAHNWSHVNGIVHDPSDDSIIVSMRHQDAVVKLTRPEDPETAPEVVWILGSHEKWEGAWDQYLLDPVTDGVPEFNMVWPYHTHSPMMMPDGNILIFDNGNYRASPPDVSMDPNINYSRAVEFSVDESSKQVSQVWEYGSPATTGERLYASFMGDADRLPVTGNILITFGGITTDAITGDSTDEPSGPDGAYRTEAHLIEVTHTDPSKKLYDIHIYGDRTLVDAVDAFTDLGWRVFRSERLPALYP